MGKDNAEAHMAVKVNKIHPEINKGVERTYSTHLQITGVDCRVELPCNIEFDCFDF